MGDDDGVLRAWIARILGASDLARVSARSVRRQLAALADGDAVLSGAMARTQKDAVRALIARVFDAITETPAAVEKNEEAEEREREDEEGEEDKDDEDEEKDEDRGQRREEDGHKLAQMDADERLARSLASGPRSTRRRASGARASTSVMRKKAAKKASTATPAKGKTRNTGFSKPMVLSEQLAKLMRLVGPVNGAPNSEVEPDEEDLAKLDEIILEESEGGKQIGAENVKMEDGTRGPEDARQAQHPTEPEPSITAETTQNPKEEYVEKISKAAETVTEDAPQEPATKAETNEDSHDPLLLPRHEVVKRMWVWIKKHNLQDPRDKRNILCDAQMEAVFKVKKVNMFKMNKLLAAHIKSADQVTGTFTGGDIGSDQDDEPDDDDEERAPAKPRKTKPRPATSSRGSRDKKSTDYVEDSDASAPDSDTDVNTTTSRSAKRSRGHVDDSDEDHEEHRPGKKGKSVFSKPYAPSAALAAVMGSEEPLARHAAVKGIWAYIKERGLQDPSDKRFILCDEKLQGLFEGETRVSGFGMNKYLGAHLTAV